jgi:glycosyltransferase involved in cell wall biosynthesis
MNVEVNQPIRVAVVTNIVPEYRLPFFRQLLSESTLRVTIFCQDRLPGVNISSRHAALGGSVRQLQFWSGASGSVSWQRLPVAELARNFDVVVFAGNPRVLSTVFWASLFRLVGKPTVIWTQGRSAGAGRWSEKIRLAWLRLFSDLLLYVDDEIEVLRQLGFRRQRMTPIRNGLDAQSIDQAIQAWPRARLEQWQERQQLRGRLIVLSCARLIERNNFHLLLRAMPEVIRRIPGTVWCAIGGGQEREALARLAAELGVQEHVRWLGGIYDEDQLAPWFLSAALLCHPGAIGLTLNHAFAYSLPVVTHDNARNHGPEFSYLRPDVNGAVFEDGDRDSLARVLSDLLESPGKRAEFGSRARDAVDRQANTAIMVEQFRTAVRRALVKAHP